VELFAGLVALGVAGVLFLVVAALAVVALSIWAIVDVCRHPEVAWRRIGQNQAVWLAVLIGSWLLTGVLGPVLALVYLATVRPRLLAAERYRPVGPPPPLIARPEHRVSDADRDLAGGWLRHHYTVGRLTYDELLQRLDEAYAARTVSDLQQALRELPQH
jgi:hypothetical protein